MELLRYWLSALADVNSFASHRNVRWLRQFFPSLQNLSPSCYISLKTNFSYWKRERERGKRFKNQKFLGLSSPSRSFFCCQRLHSSDWTSSRFSFSFSWFFPVEGEGFFAEQINYLKICPMKKWLFQTIFYNFFLYWILDVKLSVFLCKWPIAKKKVPRHKLVESSNNKLSVKIVIFTLVALCLAVPQEFCQQQTSRLRFETRRVSCSLKMITR